jgi:outer membrane protein
MPSRLRPARRKTINQLRSMRLCVGVVALFLGVVSPAWAGKESGKPLLELGVIGGGGYVPDYPAAGQNHFNAIGAPYLIYRGSFLRAGDKGIVRGRFISTDRVEFDVSLDGSYRAESDDNDARQGMPDLDYLGEVGPRLQITLAKAARDAKIDLEMPLRAVFSTDLSDLNYRGIVFHPQLAYQHENFFGRDLRFKLGIGPIFASSELMDYFYEVEPRYATASRPAYSADAGYLGSEVGLRVVKKVTGRFQVFGLGNLGLYYGAANEDSPLFRDDMTWSVGIGAAWSFYQSKRRGVK